MARKLLWGMALLVLVAGVGYAGTPPAKSAEAEVVAVLDQIVKAFEAKDLAAYSRHVAHDADMVNFGTDAVERWVGWEAYKAAMEKQFLAFEKAKLTVHDRVVKVSKGGDVAWVSELWDWEGVSQGEPFSLKGMRLTIVLEKRQGQWLEVQGHASIGVAGQAVKY